ncbi:MAG: hypothetical protein ACJAZP_003875 [Psychromonas sp.]|jgi:hypothetical protein|uniref:hypothetical protein n=1 Tax=Psychromonas sp. TaxID=1884585 RepID=UPI0039E51B29
MIFITDLHHDYLLISKMKMPIKRKTRLLTELFAQYDDVWRVVGITEKALKVFIENDFNKIKRMGINRSHRVDRIKTYMHMFENVEHNVNSWWEYFLENDDTILSTSSENMSSQFSRIIHFNNDNFLFKNYGFTWAYRKKEKAFLKELARNESLN